MEAEVKSLLQASRGLRGKLLVPVFAQGPVVAVFIVVIGLSIVTIRENLEETARIIEMSGTVKILKEAAAGYFYRDIPSETTATVFHDGLDDLGAILQPDSPLTDSVDEIGTLFDEIGRDKRRNIEIEGAIMELTESSMSLSDGYITEVVQRLTDPLEAASVTTMQRQVIVGAHINTVSNWAIEKLFYRMAYDPAAKDELLAFLQQLIENTERDIVSLEGTPFQQLPIASHESNLQVDTLIREYLDNIEAIDGAHARLSALLSSADSLLTDETVRVQEETLSAVNVSYRFIGIMIVVAIVFLATLLILLGTRISSAVVRMANMLRDISNGEGDLTRRLEVARKDEIGELARYFNATMDNIQSMIQNIQREANTLNHVGADLSSSMTEAAAAVNEITANINSVKNQVENQATGVNRADTTVEGITKSIEKLDSRITDQSANVVESTSSIEEMVANIASVTRILEKNADAFRDLMTAFESGNNQLEDVSTNIQEIARESEGLIEASTVIESIASQTNLLAMNAAIEAAHAGESGKGFAVVADEIRKLAEHSGVQGKSISVVLKKLKESIDQVATSSQSARDAFAHVAELTEVVNEQERVIKAAMDEQNVGSTQVLEAIRQINEITARVKHESNEMLSGGRTVHEEMKRLSAITVEITNSMAEMSVGTNEINIAVSHVDDISKQNKESINVLSEQIQRFKVVS